MRTYRRLWAAVTTLVALFAFTVGGIDLGWVPLVGSTLALTVMGGLMGFSWIDDGQHHWHLVGQCAFWSGIGSALLLGLPSVIGPWSLLTIAVLGTACPPAVEYAQRSYRAWRPVPPSDHPEAMSDRDLERRWRCTSDLLRHGHLTPAATVTLVQERARLLDELERRDPDEFEGRLVRAGWRSTGSVAS
jgi:hypothetical protein